MLPTGSIANIQVSGTGTTHQNIQVWASAPTNPISVTGIGPPRNSTNMVTLPSGQTVLMANLVTTASNPGVPLPASSSLGKSHIQCSQILPSGNPVVLSSGNSSMGVPMSAQLNPTTVLQGPAGSLSVALPGGMLSSTSIGSLGSAPTAYVSSTPGNLNTDPSHSVPQFVDHTISANQSSFTTTTGFQGVVQGGQVLVDQNGMKFATVQSQGKVISAATIAPQVIPCALPQSNLSGHPLPTSSAENTNNTVCTGMAATDANVSQPSTVIPQMTNVSDSNNSSKGTEASVTPASSTPNQTGESVTAIPVQTVASNNSAELSSNQGGGAQKSDQSFGSRAPPFTPRSLTELLSDLDPQLQLDPDAEEVLKNLANEFLISVAEKAQKLAAHRGSSVIDAKDINFCLERNWNITVPGYSAEDGLLRKSSLVEAHKQRLALIKKQIKKM
ncbi:unnamed protein product [Calicophoron daubneyi]|uniref:Transcription initiation factor TFIID subunit 12 n=1 Tax=Calicophoron daubneyi TaxID=300641 RepID=A0AAV2TTD0_CALDB